jgi:hypothetical protein
MSLRGRCAGCFAGGARQSPRPPRSVIRGQVVRPRAQLTGVENGPSTGVEALVDGGAVHVGEANCRRNQVAWPMFLVARGYRGRSDDSVAGRGRAGGPGRRLRRRRPSGRQLRTSTYGRPQAPGTCKTPRPTKARLSRRSRCSRRRGSLLARAMRPTRQHRVRPRSWRCRRAPRLRPKSRPRFGPLRPSRSARAPS